MSKIKLEDISAQLDEQGWKVISEKYENLESEMIFECPMGHRVFAPWKKLRTALVCPICSKQNELSSNMIQPKKKGVHRILALDQATKTSGYAIFDDGALIKYGTFTTTKSEMIDRCSDVRNWLISILETWRPDYIGIENIQFQEESEGRKMGVTVFQSLAQLQGILMITCYEAKIPFILCSTNTWRNYCGVKGKHRTDKKRSMQLIAKDLYQVNVSEDEADAIGIGRYTSSQFKPIEVVNWE